MPATAKELDMAIDTGSDDAKNDAGASNRGRRAWVGENGEAMGSGSGAGGGGGPEDFDADSSGGGGGDLTPSENERATEGGDPPGGGSA